MNLFNKETGENKSQAELLYQVQQKKKFIFRRNVILSWAGLLLFLIFLFSGIELRSANRVTSISAWHFEIVTENDVKVRKRVERVLASLPVGLPNDGISLKTIAVDNEFIRNNSNFVAQGIVQTIKISALSIMLAIVLALLAALGRLSTNPVVYAVSTFYVSSFGARHFIFKYSFSSSLYRNSISSSRGYGRVYWPWASTTVHT